MNRKWVNFTHLQLRTYFPPYFQWNVEMCSLKLFLLDLLWLKKCFSTFIHGLFCRFGLQNWQLYRKSKIFCLFDSALTFLVLKQIPLDGNSWNYAQNTGIFIVRYDWHAMHANLKILIYCIRLSLGWLWNKKQKLTQIVPGHAMSRDLDDGCKARGQLTPASSMPINCICIALLDVKILTGLKKE